MASNYESDITRFLRELKEKNPEIEREQREGRAMLWDRDLDPEQMRRWRASRVPQPPYVYQSKKYTPQ